MMDIKEIEMLLDAANKNSELWTLPYSVDQSISIYKKIISSLLNLLKELETEKESIRAERDAEIVEINKNPDELLVEWVVRMPDGEFNHQNRY